MFLRQNSTLNFFVKTSYFEDEARPSYSVFDVICLRRCYYVFKLPVTVSQ